jgi:tetratricopeptide (TPR) repeat protein
MGRFSKLDFAAQPESAAAEPLEDAWPDLDEHGCMRAGDDQFQRGLYEAGLVQYSRALRFNLNLMAAWLGQVRCLICLREYREAITWTDRALERFPDAPDLLAAKGLALALSGDWSEGLAYSDGAVELRSPSAWVWLARGETLLAAGQPEVNARRCFLKAMELSPRDWHLELRIGMAYNSAGIAAQARGPLLSAVRVAGDNPLVLYHLGLASEKTGDWHAAAGFYERAVAARPDFPEGQEALRQARGAGPLARLRQRLKGRVR